MHHVRGPESGMLVGESVRNIAWVQLYQLSQSQRQEVEFHSDRGIWTARKASSCARRNLVTSQAVAVLCQLHVHVPTSCYTTFRKPVRHRCSGDFSPRTAFRKVRSSGVSQWRANLVSVDTDATGVRDTRLACARGVCTLVEDPSSGEVYKALDQAFADVA